MQEAGAGVEDLDKAAARADDELGRAGEGLAADCPRALAGDDAAGDRQAVGADAVDGVWLELDVRIDPESLLKSLSLRERGRGRGRVSLRERRGTRAAGRGEGQGLGGQLATGQVDGRRAAHPPDLVAASLKLDQPLLASGRDVRCERNEDSAAARVEVSRVPGSDGARDYLNGTTARHGQRHQGQTCTLHCSLVVVAGLSRQGHMPADHAYQLPSTFNGSAAKQTSHSDFITLGSGKSKARSRTRRRLAGTYRESSAQKSLTSSRGAGMRRAKYFSIGRENSPPEAPRGRKFPSHCRIRAYVMRKRPSRETAKQNANKCQDA